MPAITRTTTTTITTRNATIETPLLGFPRFMPDSTFERSVLTTRGTFQGGSLTVPTAVYGFAAVWVRTRARACGSYTLRDTRNDYVQRCDDWTPRRLLLWRVTRRARSCWRSPCGC